MSWNWAHSRSKFFRNVFIVAPKIFIISSLSRIRLSEASGAGDNYFLQSIASICLFIRSLIYSRENSSKSKVGKPKVLKIALLSQDVTNGPIGQTVNIQLKMVFKNYFLLWLEKPANSSPCTGYLPYVWNTGSCLKSYLWGLAKRPKRNCQYLLE